ncbi:MAG TPA: GAF domain-containing protein, partial [Candidatus Binatia bacterium]|nr:GAF domain-containing protein [Candidatus Binatia bacterium]
MAEQAQTIAELRQQVAALSQGQETTAKELQDCRRQLAEALEHQTATSEVLGIISRSPTDVQPVLDAIVESAARVCGIDDVLLRLREGNTMVLRAHFGPMSIKRVEIDVGSAMYRWLREQGTLYVPDVLAQNDFPTMGSMGGWRTVLAVPLRRQGELIGSLNARRKDVRPFTPAQIKLLETFANQAVIAIENMRLFNELKESLEQQTATSQILGVIASSPTDIQPVLDVVAENAARLCEAIDALIVRVDGDTLQDVAKYGAVPAPGYPLPISRGTPVGRAVAERQAIHVHDLAAEVETEFLESKTRQQISGSRTVLAIPLLREGIPIGAIAIRRTEVHPFSDKQIALLKTFADQAVIAIENVRLFKEIQERNAELREALEHQTATSEVLGIISRSPTDVQPVLDAIVESAARVCRIDDVLLRLHEGELRVPRAHFGPIPIPSARAEISIDEPQVHWMREHGTLHIPDIRAQNDFPNLGVFGRLRSFLSVPLRQKGDLIGTLTARRAEVRPFTQAQIKLLETFADQAVIAIENVRLFQELKESLEQQTATSEILSVIASSPTEIQPVLETLIESATRLCGADKGFIYRWDGEFYRLAVASGTSTEFLEVLHKNPIRPGRESATGRAALERRVVHIQDVLADPEYSWAEGQRGGEIRTILAVPMLREGTVIGVIGFRRTEVQPFTDKQIELVTIFAAQAVIAIENVRLFQELKEALEQQTATSGILSVIASSPTDIQPVLDVVAETAARLCDASDAVIIRAEGESLRPAAHYGPVPSRMDMRYPLSRGFPGGRAVIDQQTIHIHDIAAEIETEFPEAPLVHQHSGARTILATPLLREGISIGAIVIRRQEVRPFSEKQIALLKTFADQAVIAIENVRLFQELETRTRELAQSVGELRALGEVGQAVSSTLDLQTVLSTIVRHAVQLSRTDGGVVYEYDEAAEEFHLRASHLMEAEVVEALKATPV